MAGSTELDRPKTDSYARNGDGTFASGPGNPGKPKGATHRASQAEIKRLRDRGPALWALVDQKLAEGDVKVLLFLLARLLPDSRTIDIGTSDPSAMAEAVTDGSLSPVEANRLAQSVRSLKEVEAVEELRQRLDAIEALLEAKGRG